MKSSLELEKQHDDIFKKSEQLEESYYQKRIKGEKPFEYSLSTWLTGITYGKIVDIQPEEDYIIFHVKIGEDTVTMFELEYTDEWDESYKLIRLLDLYSKEDDERPRIEYLYGRRIPLYIKRWSLPSNRLKVPEVEPYIPSSLDAIGGTKHLIDKLCRYTGREGELELKSTVSYFLMWWSLSTLLLIVYSLVQTGGSYIESFAHLGSVMPMIILIGGIVSLFLSVYTPLLRRVARIPYEKYMKIQNENSAT